MSRLLALCGAALVAMSCGNDPARLGPEARDTGVAEIALTATVGSTSYSVVGAGLEIVGPAPGSTTKKIVDVSEPVVLVVLKPGAYTVRLTGTPQLAPSSAPSTPIDAELVSPNPQSFNIGEFKQVPVSFNFKPKTAKLAVGVAYSLAGGYIRGTATVTSLTRDNPPPANLLSDIFDPLMDQTISFSGIWDQAVATESDGLNPGSKERHFATGDISPQFGGDGAILSGIFATRDHPDSFVTFSAKDGAVTLPFRVQLGTISGATGPGGSHVNGDVQYDCSVSSRPAGLDLTAYGATIGATGYPDGNALLNVPIKIICYRMVYYDVTMGLYGASAQLAADGFADLVPSLP